MQFCRVQQQRWKGVSLILRTLHSFLHNSSDSRFLTIFVERSGFQDVIRLLTAICATISQSQAGAGHSVQGTYQTDYNSAAPIRAAASTHEFVIPADDGKPRLGFVETMRVKLTQHSGSQRAPGAEAKLDPQQQQEHALKERLRIVRCALRVFADLVSNGRACKEMICENRGKGYAKS